MNVKDMSDDELRAVLITCDGAGKDAKTEALEELLSREYREARLEEDW